MSASKTAVSNLQLAINGNRALSQPFKVPEKGEEFWEDYNQGMSIDDLAKKYIIKPYRIPPFLWLRRIYHRLQWIMRKYG